MDSTTLIQSGGIAALSGVVFWWLSSLLKSSRMQPLIDAAVQATRHAEEKTQREIQARNEDKEAATLSLYQAAERYTALEQSKAALEQSKAELQNDLGSYRDQAATTADALKAEITDLQIKLAERESRISAAEEQIIPLQKRLNDLDQLLSSERSKQAALQTALEAKDDLAKQFKTELENISMSRAQERLAAQERETKLRSSLSEFERWQAAGLSQNEVLATEMERTKSALESAEAEAEKKMEDLRRKLAQVENKNQMLQKEILAIVGSGGAGEAAAAATAAEDLEKALERARLAEKKLAEVGNAIPDSDLRRRLRESEYRACELEFKLTEAEERAAALAKASAEPAPPPAAVAVAEPAKADAEQPSAEYLAKLHEELALAQRMCEELKQERDEARRVGLAN